MANILYPKGRENFLKGVIDLPNHDIRVAIVDGAGYTYSAAHEFWSSVPVGPPGRTAVGASGLASKTTAVPNPGTFDAAPFTWSAVSGDGMTASEFVICYNYEGASDAAAELIFILDTASGLPVTPGVTPGDITINWSTGTNRIFTI